MTTVYAIHDVDQSKLENVISEMRELGAPTIKVVDCTDYFQALEGSHRLAAAAALGLTPIWEIYEQDEEIDIDQFDWFDACNWSETRYPAGEVAGELFSPQSAVPFEFE